MFARLYTCIGPNAEQNGGTWGVKGEFCPIHLSRASSGWGVIQSSNLISSYSEVGATE